MTDARQQLLDFGRWLRTGRWVPAQIADPQLEVKFNPYHDPANGQFTFGPNGGGDGEGSHVNMARRPKVPHRQKDGARWDGGGFTGGGGGTGGGAGASGHWGGRAFTGGGGGSFGGGGATGHWPAPAAVVHRSSASAGISRRTLGQHSLVPAGSPAPSSARIAKNGYIFRHDHLERTTHVAGDLTLTSKPARSARNQRAAGRPDRRHGDDGGHFIAARFNGPTDSFNHFAQQSSINRGQYRVIEDRWAKDLDAGRHVSVDIRPRYPGGSRRPDSLDVVWKVDGRRHHRIVPN